MSIQSNQSQPYCLEMWENAILDNFYNLDTLPLLLDKNMLQSQDDRLTGLQMMDCLIFVW